MQLTTKTMTRKLIAAIKELGLIYVYSYSKNGKSRYINVRDKDWKSTLFRISDHAANPLNSWQRGFPEFEVGYHSKANGDIHMAIDYLKQKYCITEVN